MRVFVCTSRVLNRHNQEPPAQLLLPVGRDSLRSRTHPRSLQLHSRAAAGDAEPPDVPGGHPRLAAHLVRPQLPRSCACSGGCGCLWQPPAALPILLGELASAGRGAGQGRMASQEVLPAKQPPPQRSRARGRHGRRRMGSSGLCSVSRERRELGIPGWSPAGRGNPAAAAAIASLGAASAAAPGSCPTASPWSGEGTGSHVCHQCHGGPRRGL